MSASPRPTMASPRSSAKYFAGYPSSSSTEMRGPADTASPSPPMAAADGARVLTETRSPIRVPQWPQKGSAAAVMLPHLRHRTSAPGASRLPPAPSPPLGTALAGVAGAYAACTSAADVVRGFPQSEQYRAVASFSRPRNEQNVLEDEEAGVAPDGVVRSEAGKEVKPRWSGRGIETS